MDELIPADPVSLPVGPALMPPQTIGFDRELGLGIGEVESYRPNRSVDGILAHRVLRPGPSQDPADRLVTSTGSSLVVR